MKQKELEKLVRELQNISNHQLLKLQEKEEKLAKLASVERNSKSLHVTILEAEEKGVINYLNREKEKEDMITKSKQ